MARRSAQLALPGIEANGFTSTPRRTPGAYKGASITDPALQEWTPRRYSADGGLLSDLDRLTSRSLDSERNNGIARAAIQTHVDNVVGTGFRLSARPDWKALGQTKEWAQEWSRQVEAAWYSWAWSTDCHAGDVLTFDQITAQIYRSELAAGEALALPLWEPSPLRRFALQLQTVDPARLSQPASAPETVQFHGGIEFNDLGAPIAYNIRKTHPGDRWVDAKNPAGSAQWERIPRRGVFNRLRVLHVYDQRQSGQSRGEPLLTAVLPEFKQLDRYINAEVMAAVVNAMVAGVIETPLEAADIVDLFRNDAVAYQNSREKHAVKLQGGTLATLFPGDKLSSFMPNRPATGFGAFVENVIRIISVGVDLPYELLFKDFSKANYSSMRAAMLEAWRSFRRRRDALATQWLDPVFALWLEEAVSKNIVDAPNFYENRAAYQVCRWTGAGRGWVDPVKEAQAAQIRMEIGVSTLEDECAEQGKDWRDVLEQQAVEMAERKRLGLEPPKPATPGTVVPESPADDADPNGPPGGGPQNANRPDPNGAGTAGQ